MHESLIYFNCYYMFVCYDCIMAFGAIDADLFKKSPLLLITEDLNGERLLLQTDG